ncbi:Rad4-domain-containing protein [Laetiporus sulphureus 93-53]|uniref:Rad4-domain-containing protein n=1 Tax=Laetiporus sulphureus 93-53 TaxID=1314785 RepID=A0A165HKB8_9APHY|nr:Rad4-domain-containing protein [Laetiporus sulphureus 93-53]KZT11843.1 Rad4-domain-containing protein [Laetiporus sulphureus 93-53]
MQQSTENSSVAGADSDDDFDWEEVVVPQQEQVQELPAVPDAWQDDIQEGPSEKPHIEITIQTQKRVKKGTPKKNPQAEKLYAERLARLTCHQLHTVALLANARIRDKWINDPLLHARLMSLTPLPLQNAFATIIRSRYPDAAQRGRMFEAAIVRLTEWWSSSFRVMPTGHLRNRTFDEVQRTLSADPKGKGKARARDEDDEDDDDGERIRSEKSLMKHALMMRGSRDTSAQLFTALCRALGIPARLVVSLQSVPWQAGVGKPKSPAKKREKDNGKGKAKAKAEEDEDEDDMDMEEVAIPDDIEVFPGNGQRLDGRTSTPINNGAPKGKGKTPPVIKLRKSHGRKLGSSSVQRAPARERTPDPTLTPPVFWTEVFSRADARWLPVDPIRCIISKRKAFDPNPNPNAPIKPDRTRPLKVENRMVYVVAFEEDGFARDVTPRYAREYGAKVAKVQQGGKGRKEWWERIVRMVNRPYRLHRDDLEDDELHTHQITEGMPTTMIGFKDHPLYVLGRHLKRDEVVHPVVELGKFRGEPVYARSSVLSLKTAENWMRQGRKVREGAQPMKWVKQHAMTVNKQRAIEMALDARRERAAQGLPEAEGFGSEDGVMQGLYAESQTELCIPEPVVNGKIPRNDFGNIDLYVPSMLPAGAVHIPYKGTAKVARQLGFDYAEAVTGFEFKKRQAFPVITGIVVAAENEEAVLEAYWEAEHDAEQKRRAKREEQVIKRWTKLIQGLRIRQRLQEQYAHPDQRGSSPAVAVDEVRTCRRRLNSLSSQQQGGFLTGADDVVQPYTLPRNFHPHTSTTISLAASREESMDRLDANMMEEIPSETPSALQQFDEEDEEEGMEEVEVPHSTWKQAELPEERIPKTILELVEDAARQEEVPLSGGQKEVQMKSELEPVARSTRAAAKQMAAFSNGRMTPEKTTMPTRTSRVAARGTRKRTREDDADSNPGMEEENVPSTRGSPAKRAKKAAPSVPPSTRVLRTRTSKSASKIQEEVEMEDAYRRATCN